MNHISFLHAYKLTLNFRYYVVYVFESAGLTGIRTNLVADVRSSYCYITSSNTEKPCSVYSVRLERRSYRYHHSDCLPRLTADACSTQFRRSFTSINGVADQCSYSELYSWASGCSLLVEFKVDLDTGRLLIPLERLSGSLTEMRQRQKLSLCALIFSSAGAIPISIIPSTDSHQYI